MLIDKSGLLLSEKETQLIGEIVCDNESGRFLLRSNDKFPEGYWEMRQAIAEANHAENPTDKQKQIIEYYKQSEDYFYWKKLPDDKKLFYEIETYED